MLIVAIWISINGIAQHDESNDTVSKRDIWNLPELAVSEGPCPASWAGLCRMYSVPQWWHEAKFGTWSHWDPQSMPEQSNW
ncbi:MAG: alpha-L-fucosidase [Marinilabiliaceae bacterium]